MLLLPILAATLVLADGFLTRRAMRSGASERNPVRRALIRAFGADLGTVGVAVVAAAALLIAWGPFVSHYGIGWAGFGYVGVCSIYLYAVAKHL